MQLSHGYKRDFIQWECSSVKHVLKCVYISEFGVARFQVYHIGIPVVCLLHSWEVYRVNKLYSPSPAGGCGKRYTPRGCNNGFITQITESHTIVYI